MTSSSTAANRRGVLAMAGGMASFVANDTLVKVVSESLPTAQLIFVRGVCATLLLLVAAHFAGATRSMAKLASRRVVARALFDAFATVTYLTSLFHLPIANATAINMASPLMIALVAVVAFGEKVGPGRWLAIATGFVGVLLVVQPSGAAFNAYALLCLSGTVLHTARDLTTRGLDRGIPSVLVAFSTAITVMVLTGLWTATQGWQPMNGQHFALLAAASAFLSSGYYLLTVAMRSGDISLVAPFRYAGLLFAIVLGFLVWGDVPNPLAWAGIALVMGAGLYVLHDERQRARPELEPVPD